MRTQTRDTLIGFLIAVVLVIGALALSGCSQPPPLPDLPLLPGQSYPTSGLPGPNWRWQIIAREVRHDGVRSTTFIPVCQ